MHVSLVEYGVARFPEGMEGWRMFRIEYGGHAESCVTEGTIWLPPGMRPEQVETLLESRNVSEQPVMTIYPEGAD